MAPLEVQSGPVKNYSSASFYTLPQVLMTAVYITASEWFKRVLIYTHILIVMVSKLNFILGEQML